MKFTRAFQKLERDKIKRNAKLLKEVDVAKKRDTLNKWGALNEMTDNVLPQIKELTELAAEKEEADVHIKQQKTKSDKSLIMLNGKLVSEEHLCEEIKGKIPPKVIKNTDTTPNNVVTRCFKNQLIAQVDSLEEISEKVCSINFYE